MTEEQKRLEKVLLEFIEEAKKEPTPETIKIIPSVARELISVWEMNEGDNIDIPELELDEIKRLIVKNGEFSGSHIGGTYARLNQIRKEQKHHVIAIMLLQLITLLTVLLTVL